MIGPVSTIMAIVVDRVDMENHITRHPARNAGESQDLDAAPFTPSIRTRIVGDPESTRSMTEMYPSTLFDTIPTIIANYRPNPSASNSLIRVALSVRPLLAGPPAIHAKGFAPTKRGVLIRLCICSTTVCTRTDALNVVRGHF